MIERQPADEHIVGLHADGGANGADVGQQVGVGQHHALGVAGAARGVLDEGDVVAPRRPRRGRPGDALREPGHGDDPAQAGHAGFEQARHRHRLRHGDEDARLGILEDAGVAAHVLLDLRRPRRWVDRHRDAASKKNAEVGKEILERGWQHDRHRLPRLQAAGAEPRRHGRRAGPQVRVVEPLLAVALGEQHDLGALAVGLHMPVEHFEQGRGGSRGGGIASGGGDLRHDRGHGAGWRRARGRCGNRRQQVAQRLGVLQRGLRQRDAEGALDAQQQLDPGQAIEAEVAFEPAVEGDLERRGGRLAMQLGVGHPHHGEQGVRRGAIHACALRCPRSASTPARMTSPTTK